MKNNMIRASTQEHLDVYDISDDLIVLKDGGCSLILQVTAINFGLLSELEQDAIIYAYAGLLNSLTYPIQIIIRSIIKDVSNYITLVKKQEIGQKNPLLKEQLTQYRQFVESLVKENKVLDKKFYIAIPFSTIELGIAANIGKSYQKTGKLPYPKEQILERAKMNLFPKRDHLIRQFARIGLQSKQLVSQELLELLHGLYNQESVGQRLLSSKEYTAPLTSFNPAGQAKTSQPTDNLSLKVNQNYQVDPINNSGSTNQQSAAHPATNPDQSQNKPEQTKKINTTTNNNSNTGSQQNKQVLYQKIQPNNINSELKYSK